MTERPDLYELERLARAATEGPWHPEKCGREDPGTACGIGTPGSQWGGDIVSDTNRHECCHMMREADANHIAAFAPPTALWLVERVRELEEAVASALTSMESDHDPERSSNYAYKVLTEVYE